MLALILLLIFLAGYATQRGSVCAVAATYELVVERKANRYLGFLFCAACGLLMMALGEVAGRSVFEQHGGLTVTAASVIGGAAVGIGVFVNGRCAFGTVAELGLGKLPRVATIVGFVAGAAMVSAASMHIPTAVAASSPLVGMSGIPTLAMALLLVLTLGVALRRLVPRPAAPEWSPLRTMAVIGVCNGALLVFAQRWPYTNLLIDIAHGGGEGLVWRGVMAVVFICGAAVGGIALGQFRLRGGDARQWLRAFAGGLIMGGGALLVPGGNDAMLLVGLPLLLPNLVAAYLAMTVVLAVIVWLESRQPTSGRHVRSPNSPSAG